MLGPAVCHYYEVNGCNNDTNPYLFMKVPIWFVIYNNLAL